MTSKEALLEFVRVGIGQKGNALIPDDFDWVELKRLADEQGVAAIMTDGIEKLNLKIPFQIKMEMVGAIVACEQTYQHHNELMIRLARQYNKGGFKMMILKGWGVSLNYPIPNHRPSGDLDIWNFGLWKEADAYLETKGVRVDNSHHHHSVFYIEDLMVENHYDFINVYARRSNRKVEKILKEKASKGFSSIRKKNTTIFLPSANFNALFLLRHTASHFTSTGMIMRQVLDWGFFMKKHHHLIDWDWYIPCLKRLGLWPFFNIINSICVNKLSFETDIFHNFLDDRGLLMKVLDEMLFPEIIEKENGSLTKSLWLKPIRWWKNRWKYKLCYNDGIVSSFLYALWAKVLKPIHFRD